MTVVASDSLNHFTFSLSLFERVHRFTELDFSRSIQRTILIVLTVVYLVPYPLTSFNPPPRIITTQNIGELSGLLTLDSQEISFDALQGVAGYVTQVRGETFRLEWEESGCFWLRLEWNEERVWAAFDALQGVAGYVTQVRGKIFRLEWQESNQRCKGD